ncbi:MAG: MBL fold metallo-hydrolase, partial [Chloroflexi bacterium RBG_13_54_8]
HQHGDHNGVTSVKSKPEIVDAPGVRKVKGIDFRGVATHHDEAQGKERGPNIIFCFTLDGMRICHLGDLGHPLDSSQIGEIGEVDLLFVPVGGLYTIDAQAATKVCDSLSPRVVVPMHYKTARCDYPIAGVDGFLKGRKNIRRLDSSEIELRKDQLPSVAETVVLRHAL